MTRSHYSERSGHNQDVIFPRPIWIVGKVTVGSLVFPYVFVTLVRFKF